MDSLFTSVLEISWQAGPIALAGVGGGRAPCPAPPRAAGVRWAEGGPAALGVQPI